MFHIFFKTVMDEISKAERNLLHEISKAERDLLAEISPMPVHL